MARSTRGLFKRGNTWWMTYREAIGEQRFEARKTTNRREAEQRLINRRKEAVEGIILAPAANLKQRYLAFVEYQRGLATKKIPCTHFTGVWGNPPIHTLTVDILDHHRALQLAEKVGPATIDSEDVRHGFDRPVGPQDWRTSTSTISARPSRPGSLCKVFRSLRSVIS